MTNVSKPTKVFIEPYRSVQSIMTTIRTKFFGELTIQNGLAQCHDSPGEQHKNSLGHVRSSDRRFVRAFEEFVQVSEHEELLSAVVEQGPQVVKIHCCLYSVQGCLGRRETDVVIISRPAIDIVHRSIKSVRFPDG